MKGIANRFLSLPPDIRLLVAVTGYYEPEEYERWRTATESNMTTLTPKEREVIDRKFGLSGYGMHTRASIGMVFGLSGERIRQIEAKALRKLRRPVRLRENP